MTFRLVVASGGFQPFRAGSGTTVCRWFPVILVGNTFTRRRWASEILWTEVSKC